MELSNSRSSTYDSESRHLIKQELDEKYTSTERDPFLGECEAEDTIEDSKTIINHNIKDEYFELCSGQDVLNTCIKGKPSGDKLYTKDAYQILDNNIMFTNNYVKQELVEDLTIKIEPLSEINSSNQFGEDIVKSNLALIRNDGGECFSRREIVNFEEGTSTYSVCLENSLENRKTSVHTNYERLEDKNFKCPLCDYNSSRKYVLKVHINSVHLKQKNYKCDLCNFGSSTQGNLKQHVKSVHLKLKDHECDLCDFKSALKATLKIHIEAVHLKEKNFECRFCDFNSSRKADLISHIDSVHLKVNNFKCDLCGLALTTKRSLRRHVKSVHLKLKTF